MSHAPLTMPCPICGADFFDAAHAYHPRGAQGGPLFRCPALIQMSEYEYARFMSRVEHEPTSGCWLWSGSWGRAGYGHILYRGEAQAAHRVSYQHHVGPIPEGLELDHWCRVRACVNPGHLRPMTHTENVGRREFRATACKYGHPYTRAVGMPGRCAVCRGKAWRAFRARRRQASA